jgi:hypothetical protein
MPTTSSGLAGKVDDEYGFRGMRTRNNTVMLGFLSSPDYEYHVYVANLLLRL